MMIRLAVVASLLLLSACRTLPTPTDGVTREQLAAQTQREIQLKQQTRWHLIGRIAVSDGKDGGSGRLDWKQDGDQYEITLNAPVSRRSWRLTGDVEGARLEGLDGGPYFAANAEELLRQYVNWDVPLADLADWVRGLRAVGSAQMAFLPSGLPAQITQHGWEIEYRQFESDATDALPVRVFASRATQRVRVQVDQWNYPRRGS